MNNRPEATPMWKCGHCDEIHDDEDEANDCCRPEATPMWKCGHCDEIHDDEDEANDCCRPEIYELWACPECKKVYDEEHEALECCAQYTNCPGCARDWGVGHINHFAVTIAGHCNVCNPFFTVDQKFAIQDSLLRYSPSADPAL